MPDQPLKPPVPTGGQANLRVDEACYRLRTSDYSSRRPVVWYPLSIGQCTCALDQLEFDRTVRITNLIAAAATPPGGPPTAYGCYRSTQSQGI